MILMLLSLVVFLYIAVSLLLFAPCGPYLKGFSLAALLLVSLKYVIYEQVGGAFFAPALPRPFLLVAEALFGAMILLFFLLLLKDVFLLLAWGGKRLGLPWPFPLFPAWFKVGMVATALLLGAWGTWQSVRVPQVRTVELHLEKLPPGLDGFSVVQLTDLHIGPLQKKEWLQQVVRAVNGESPDLIVLTGDYIDGTASALAEDIAPLAGLRARHGVYGVTGNHEYYWGAAEWSTLLQKLHVTMLFNEHRVLHVGGDKIVIAGLPDHAARSFGGKGPDCDAALRGAPDAPRILLAHQPRDAAKNSLCADVQLSGHTHGGLLFFLQPLIAGFNQGFVEGLYAVGGMKLYVSPGTGLWGAFSCRLGVAPEITRLVLRAGK